MYLSYSVLLSKFIFTRQTNYRIWESMDEKYLSHFSAMDLSPHLEYERVHCPTDLEEYFCYCHILLYVFSMYDSIL